MKGIEKIRNIIREGYNYPNETVEKIRKIVLDSVPKDKSLDTDLITTIDEAEIEGFNNCVEEMRDSWRTK